MGTSGPLGRTSVADAAWSRLWRRRTVAALTLGGLAVVYAVGFLLPSGALALDASATARTALVGLAGAFVAGEYPRARRAARRRWEPVSRWTPGTPGSDRVAALVHGEPDRHARAVVAEWAAAVGLAAAVLLADGVVPGRVAVVAVCGLAMGLHMGWLVRLLVEDALRPLAADLAEEGHDPPTESLALRMLVTLFLCAGVVVLGVVLVLTWSGSTSGVDVARALLPLAGFVLLEGGGVVVWFALDLGRTVDDLRTGLARVEAGDLTARVAVDDRTEVGGLQRSFNAMAEGLADRAVLERLLAGQVGRAVAEESRARGRRLPPERRRLSLLFVDMVGSTELAARVEPEAFARVLDAYFDVVVRVVEAHGGEVLQFQGDGAVCSFGAPTALAAHADAALRAARALPVELRDDPAVEPGFRVAVAVASGEAVVGHLGSDDRHSYSPIGDAVNEAARLVEEAKADPGGVLATGDAVTAATAEERHRWTLRGEVVLRGRAEATQRFAPRDRLRAEPTEPMADRRVGVDDT